MERISKWTEYHELGRFRESSIPTPVQAEWLNMVQEEIVNVINTSSLPLDETDNRQLKKAIDEILGKYKKKKENLCEISDAYTKTQFDKQITKFEDDLDTLLENEKGSIKIQYVPSINSTGVGDGHGYRYDPSTDFMEQWGTDSCEINIVKTIDFPWDFSTISHCFGNKITKNFRGGKASAGGAYYTNNKKLILFNNSDKNVLIQWRAIGTSTTELISNSTFS